MIFNGVDLGDYLKIKSIRGRGLSPNELVLIDIPGMDGSYMQDKKRPIRLIEIEGNIKAENREELRTKIDDLNGILSVDEPVPINFYDEPNMTYYGMPRETAENNEFTFMHESVLTIVCLDPYKYGPEKQEELEFQTTINNEGTAESYPIFELEVLAPITYAMVQNHLDEYLLIGVPSDDDVVAVDTRSSVLYENGSTIGDWSSASIDMVDSQFIDSIDGVMGSDGAGIRPSTYGTPGDLQRGASIYKELPSAIQDFEIESTFDILSNREEENFRMGIYFHDENMNNLGHLGLKDNSRNHKRRVALGRAGHYRGGGVANGNVIGDSSWINDNARDTTLFYLRAKREGQRYTFYIGEWQNFRHINVWEGVYNDVDNDFQGRLKYITLFIGSWQDRPTPSRLRINSVEVFELTTAQEDQTPYIATTGDVIIFDTENEEMLLNGEDATPLKDFGANYFTLKKGDNDLILHPEENFNATVRYRERFK